MPIAGSCQCGKTTFSIEGEIPDDAAAAPVKVIDGTFGKNLTTTTPLGAPGPRTHLTGEGQLSVS